MNESALVEQLLRWLELAQVWVLVYFAAITCLTTLVGYLGLRTLRVSARLGSAAPLEDLLAHDTYKPVSILVPARNEAGSIVESVRSFLRLRFPEFEVIVVSDGSEDGTVDRLAEAFALVEEPRVYRRGIATRPVGRILRSVRHPNLLVVEKERGGKADALNAALNLARYPLICTVDADSLVDADALVRAARQFVDDSRVVAVGGSIRPLNGASVYAGQVTGLRLPRRWIERFQIVEYARSFFTNRVGWGSLGALPIISGAFGVFRREIVLEVGGYRSDTVGEDLELVLRLHRTLRDRGVAYRIVSLPEPLCWTEVPSDWASLRRQRNRWQRGLVEALWIHRGMLFRRRHGRLGTFTLPYLWIFEAGGPLVEVLGYLVVIGSLAAGVLDPWFAGIFLVLAMGAGAILSEIAVGVEMLLRNRYPRLQDRLALLFAALVEVLGYRQVIVVERFVANFQVWGRRGVWGAPRRQGIESTPPALAAGAHLDRDASEAESDQRRSA